MNSLSSIFSSVGLVILELKKPCFSRFLEYWIALLLRMLNSDSLSKLIYQHEVLCARQEIQEQHLNIVIREVYENIGQVLSLANMEIGMLQEEDSMPSTQRLNRISELIRKAIADLRQMSSNLYPDLKGLKLDTLIAAVLQEVSVLPSVSADFRIRTDGKKPLILLEKGLILFRVIKEILTSISKSGILISASAESQREDLTFNIHFKGERQRLNLLEKLSDGQLTTEQKINLIGGTLKFKQEDSSTGYQEITIHLKNCSNEYQL